jgi:signal transduction histidine kinase
MLHRAAGIGVLVAVDRGSGGDSFGLADEQLLRTFAASASNAVAIKRSVEADRLRATIAAAEAERRRWARDLHDQTLQSLGALRMLLSGAARRGEAEGNAWAIQQAVQDIETEIDALRGIITDLRPSMLDDLGLGPALEALIEHQRDAGLRIESEISLPEIDLSGSGRAGASSGSGLDTEMSTTIYRLVQESLTNVVKHAQASRCRVRVHPEASSIHVEVADDGRGYDTASRPSGFGLAGIRERVYLVGGTIDFESSELGTTVRARLPLSGRSG